MKAKEGVLLGVTHTSCDSAKNHSQELYPKRWFWPTGHHDLEHTINTEHSEQAEPSGNVTQECFCGTVNGLYFFLH